MFVCTTIHGGGFKNMNYNGYFFIQLHVFDRFNSYVKFKNHYFRKCKYNFVIEKQFLLYMFKEGNMNGSSDKL